MAKSRSQCVFIFRAVDGIFMIRESSMRVEPGRLMKREDINLPNGDGLAKFEELANHFSLPFCEETTVRLPGCDVKEPRLFRGYKILTLRPFLCEVPQHPLGARASLQGCLQLLQVHPLGKQIIIPAQTKANTAHRTRQCA